MSSALVDETVVAAQLDQTRVLAWQARGIAPSGQHFPQSSIN